MVGFSINLKGRIKNFPLPKNQPLIPLFEAIVNSIHAIEERGHKELDFHSGHIIIEIKRDSQLAMPGSLPLIKDFIIKDNGVGFDEPNFKSFLESDSTYKAALGGKGVGRFSWLAAFNKADIESTYSDKGQFVKRSFTFSPDEPQIDDSLVHIQSAKDNLTIVKLCDCVSPYKDHIPRQADTIAQRIIQHCLVYFMSQNCPQIDLVDINEAYDLNKIFNETIKTDCNKVELHVGDKNFELLHVKAEEVSINGNKLFLCANNRLVETKELEKYITDLDREIFQRCGFWYIGVLTGEYLDDNVDMNRLSFSIPDGGIADGLINIISMDQIMTAVAQEIKKYLAEYLAPITQDKNKRIKKYVTYEAPQFRHLLKYMPNDIAAIKPNLSDDKLDDELNRIKRRFDKEIKDQNAELLQALNEGACGFKEYESKFQEQIKKVTDANGAALAEYVTHRKVIIDLLESGIKRKEDGKFQKEKFIHDLIYPTRTTSDEEPYDNHNLWLIDEKLAYSSYICSDVPFDNDPKQERADIMILDSPIAVSEDKNDGSVFDTITLFELKRPMRDDYTELNNPIKQLYDYVDKIKLGEAKDKDGRFIHVGEGTKFYLYAVCDITPKLEKIIMHNGYDKTPDALGYYNYNDRYKAYIEILPFDKMINDAKRRNKILFSKLGI